MFGHGFEFQDAAARVAKEYPKTIFVTTSGSRTGPNLAPIVFELEQAAYLCGLVAGRMSKTGKAGMVGGVELPSIKSTFLAFEAGFKAGHPGGTAQPVFTGSFEDVAGAKAASLALADQGCDFLFQNADAAALGVFKGAEERGDPGLRHEQGPERPLAGRPRLGRHRHAARLRRDRAPREGRDVRRPAAPLRPFERRDLVRLESGGARARCPPPVVEEAKATGEKIEAGALVVPRGNF